MNRRIFNPNASSRSVSASRAMSLCALLLLLPAVFSTDSARATSAEPEWRTSGAVNSVAGGAQRTARRPGRSRAAAGQTRLSGTVYDPNKAVVVKARVTVVNAESLKTVTVASDGEGKYEVTALEPGVYTVTIESPGFSKFEKTDLRLNKGQRLEVDATLEVGGIG